MFENSHKYFGETKITKILNCEPEILDGIKVLD